MEENKIKVVQNDEQPEVIFIEQPIEITKHKIIF